MSERIDDGGPAFPVFDQNAWDDAMLAERNELRKGEQAA